LTSPVDLTKRVFHCGAWQRIGWQTGWLSDGTLARALLRGGEAGAVKDLRAIDKGPNPDGYPQFWDARAAQAVALYVAGKRDAAELEWEDLCRPHPPPPPSVPTNKVFAGVNLAAQNMLKAEGKVLDLTSNSCENFDTGLYMPCDDAGIPGLGGSSSPCLLYNRTSAAARGWPDGFIDSLEEFRKGSPTR